MDTKIHPRSCGVHSGAFHADEVTACALLLMFGLICRNNILRTRDRAALARCDFVCDVGGEYDPVRRRFDHHQSDYRGELSSAGMVWKYLHDEGFVDVRLFAYFNHSLIQGIDAIDNGRDPPQEGHCTFSQVVANFVPAEYDAGEERLHEAFEEALTFVLGHLVRLKKKFQYILKCEKTTATLMQQVTDVLIFDVAMPWQESFFALGGEAHPALFVVMPSGHHWKLRGIPPSARERMAVRVPLPAAWAGLIDEDLKAATGIPGAIFCHKGRFVSVWETKEDALRALEYTLRMRSQE